MASSRIKKGSKTRNNSSKMKELPPPQPQGERKYKLQEFELLSTVGKCLLVCILVSIRFTRSPYMSRPYIFLDTELIWPMSGIRMHWQWCLFYHFTIHTNLFQFFKHSNRSICKPFQCTAYSLKWSLSLFMKKMFPYMKLTTTQLFNFLDIFVMKAVG